MAEVAEDTQEQPRADMAVLQVFAEMREDSLTRGRDISVRNADSRLILTGRVRTEAVRQRALAIVHERLGSLTLVDSLVVDPAAPDPAARDGA